MDKLMPPLSVPLTPEVLDVLRRLAAQGGHARAQAMSPAQRTHSARRAGRASAKARRQRRRTEEGR